MKTIMLVGFPPRGDVAERLFRSGFFVLAEDDAVTALAVLRALIVNGFVIDVGDAAVGGEALIERLRLSTAWHDLPIVATGASAAQCEGLAERGSVNAIITARDSSADVILAALRPLVEPNAPAKLGGGGGAPGRRVRGDAGADVSLQTFRR